MKRKAPQFNIKWLDEYINQKKDVFIHYTSYTKGYHNNYENGIILYYKDGNLISNVRFNESFPKERFSKNIQVHLRTIIRMFEIFRFQLTDKPIILLSSIQAVEWLKRGDYKYFKIDNDMKAKLYTYCCLFSPEFIHYDVLSPPYSLLREKCLLENSRIKKQMIKGFNIL